MRIFVRNNKHPCYPILRPLHLSPNLPIPSLCSLPLRHSLPFLNLSSSKLSLLLY